MPGPASTAPVSQESCVVTLANGSRCTAMPQVGHYCEEHQRIRDQDFAVFQILGEHFRQDLREFWQRSNFYLTIDSALITVCVAQSQGSLRWPLAIFGLILSIVWFLVARSAITWLDTWRTQLCTLDLQVNQLAVFNAVETNAHGRRWGSPAWITQWLPILFALAWIAILFVA